MDRALLTDLYQLTMAQAYLREGLRDRAVFSLYFRTMPARRNYALACGLDDALRYLETLFFPPDAIAFLETLGTFGREFLDWLETFRFRGDAFAVPEGTPVFPEEPILEVEAPLPEAQIVESFLMTQIHLQTVLASKAARVVHAAQGRPVVDFALRRMHGGDAALLGARAFYIAGAGATSNVEAARRYGIPASGTMGHSYIQAHDREEDAFSAFAGLYPGAVLLVDTYDTTRGVERAAAVARAGRKIRAVRLDSGDLGGLAKEARRILDAAGLRGVQVFASGGLDEDRIAALLAGGAPIDGFGVGTSMGVSDDAPALDMAYKLASYAGKGRLKTAAAKRILPGAKQVFREESRDVLARRGEALPGRPLLSRVMEGGVVVGRPSLEEAREHARREIAALPARIRALDPAHPPWPVVVSDELERYRREVEERVAV